MNNKFFKSALILIIGGFFTRIIGLLIKIIYTRIVLIDGVSLISLINPTYSLLITLASFNIMVSTSMRISSNNKSSKVLINSCYIMFLLNLVLLVAIFLLAPFISNNLLHNKDTYYPILAASLSLPFVSLGYVIKGYFYGKQNIMPHMISNVLEQLFRLLLIVAILPKIVKYGTVITISVLLLFNVLSESFSIIILYLFLPKNKGISKDDLKLDKKEILEILKITVPSISGRILANIGFFLEPIIFTSILLSKGVSNSYITQEYGIYNAYVVSTLLFPSFIISAISNALLPEISKYYSTNNYNMIRKRIREALLISLCVGIISTMVLYFFAPLILRLLYDTNRGLEYIRVLAPFFILYYIEAPLSTILIAINKVKLSTIISTTGIILKLIIMTILGLLGFKIYSLIYAEIFNIIYVTLFSYIMVRFYIK